MNNWKSIRLELGRMTGFPRGSVSRGYLIQMPLDDDDLVDQAAFDESPYRATVRRYWSTEPDESGAMVKVADSWAIRCDGRPDRMLELNGRPIRLGQQFSVVDPDGSVLPFKVASVR